VEVEDMRDDDPQLQDESWGIPNEVVLFFSPNPVFLCFECSNVIRTKFVKIRLKKRAVVNLSS